MLGTGKIIGVSVSNVEQANLAAETGCDYIGVGPIYATGTKPDHNPPLGTTGARALLEHICTLPGPSGNWGRDVPAVAIGGINLNNIYYVMHQSVSPASPARKHLAGVAVVSAIMAASDACESSKVLRKLVDEVPPFAERQHGQFITGVDFSENFISVLAKVVTARPMVHHITNNVVKNFSANVTLAIGASPIMSEEISEVGDLANHGGALVLNMGTAGKDAQPLFLAAMRAANARGNPVVFDPVGAGATPARLQFSHLIVSSGFCDVIKGNESEIRAVYGDSSVQQRGVDSAHNEAADPLDRIRIAKALALRERNIVVMTGVVDIVTDGVSIFKLSDGSHYQARVTGTGCSLGSIIAACMVVNKERKLTAVVAAVCAYNAAARVAAERKDTRGPGSWHVNFMDTLFELRQTANPLLERTPEGKRWWELLYERADRILV